MLKKFLAVAFCALMVAGLLSPQAEAYRALAKGKIEVSPGEILWLQRGDGSSGDIMLVFQAGGNRVADVDDLAEYGVTDVTLASEEDVRVNVENGVAVLWETEKSGPYANLNVRAALRYFFEKIERNNGVQRYEEPRRRYDDRQSERGERRIVDTRYEFRDRNNWSMTTYYSDGSWTRYGERRGRYFSDYRWRY